MKLPDLDKLPEEDPQPQPEPAPKSTTRKVVHRPIAAHHPTEEQRKPATLFGFRGTKKKTGKPRSAFVRTRHQGPEQTPVSPEQAPQPVEEDWNPLFGSAPPEGQTDPGGRLRSIENAGRESPPAKLPWTYRIRLDKEKTRIAYWDVGAMLSLIGNAVLLGLVLVMAIQIRQLKTTMNGLMGGLYENFGALDNASITTNITVEAQIPVSFMLPVQQNTTVTLTEAVAIPNTYVVIDTGIIDINGPAKVTLPRGTNLPIALTMDIPVQTTIPITLQVPVNIPLSQTQLHTPFINLQKVIQPLYCTFNINAQYPDGIYLCAEHDAPTPGPGVP